MGLSCVGCVGGVVRGGLKGCVDKEKLICCLEGCVRGCVDRVC